MTKAEMIEMRRRIAVWRDTDIGKLFERYDAALGNAWVIDQTSSSPKRMDEAWEKARVAKVEFLDKVCDLAGVANPYT